MKRHCDNCGMDYDGFDHRPAVCAAHLKGKRSGMEYSAIIAETSSNQCHPEGIAKRIRRSKP